MHFDVLCAFFMRKLEINRRYRTECHPQDRVINGFIIVLLSGKRRDKNTMGKMDPDHQLYTFLEIISLCSLVTNDFPISDYLHVYRNHLMIPNATLIGKFKLH